MIPAFFISLMIREASDPGTSYYAGLTLCLVATGFMFHWTFIESAIAPLDADGFFQRLLDHWRRWEECEVV